MEEVEQVDEDVYTPSKTRGRGQKRARYYNGHVIKKVVPLNMLARCPEEEP